MNNHIVDGFEFTDMHYPYYNRDAIRIVEGRKIEEYQGYIRRNNIEKAEIIVPDIAFLRECPSFKHLRITPSFNAPNGFDFSPLYDTPEIISLNCQNQYGNRGQYISKIDYDNINGLVDLFVSVNAGTFGYNKIETLKSLSVGGFSSDKKDITDLFCSKDLDTLELIDCKIHSLTGIEKAPKMQCLYLSNNRSLRSIDQLYSVKDTLKALRIKNCSKIKDFSVLGKLQNLELLELSGSNELPGLGFLKTMNNLKTFTFSMNVVDGDITPCLPLSYVYSERNRNHYNVKDADLPKGHYIHGNESIEEWRRLE